MVFTISKVPSEPSMIYHLLREAFYSHPNQDCSLPLISIIVPNTYLNLTPTYIKDTCEHVLTPGMQKLSFSLSVTSIVLYTSQLDSDKYLMN